MAASTSGTSWGALLMAAFLLLLVSPADGRRHLIRHGRQRRQHQHQHHHFQQNVTLGLNLGAYHESGPWGPWTASSSCSRTCGGGVAYQTRVCEELRADGTHGCVGPFKRYFSCNIEECPDYTKDFREEQCARFNSIAFKGRYYSWVPYYKAVNPCELNCRPIGERFYTHSPKTIDGTRCHDDGSLDVCINGACMPVGCDKMLGSDAVEDKCRKCRGYGTSCSTFEGVFDLDNLEVGYNDILLIPTGATNIRIEEKFPTNNYLAVRNKTGYYYLNGNWRIEFPRSIRFAGTVFHYERRNHGAHGANAPESLVALGPTTETILIVLLYQEKNLGITYEYSVPVGVSQPQPGTYSWNFGDFGECSQTCGGGMQSRLVYCSNAVTSERVSDDLCNPTIKPQATKVCNPEPCPASWYVGEWEKCSKTCGNGIQFRLVFCHYETEGGTMLADDSDCLSSVGPKPERRRECSSEAECASWEAGNWTECDRLCGKGTQVRDVQCIYPLEGNAVEVLDDLGCDQSTKPATNRTCEIRPCDGTEWVTSPWSGCDTPCSSQIETRDVLCVLEDGTLLPDEYCDEEKRPNATKPCDEDVSALDSQCLYMWYYYPWSPCSTECGRGLKTRKVFCGTVSEGKIQNVTDDLCNPDDQLPSTEECVIEAVCNGTWITAPWNRCSTPCGGGQRTRIIICLVNGKPAAPKNCDAGKRPFDSESCNMNACDDDLCTLPKVPGSCSGQFVQWFYDPETDQCREFAYSGCQGNANRFNDRESCEHRCRKGEPLPTEQPVDRVTPLHACAQPKQPGPCYGVLPLWYYDAYARECRNFTYGGCEGNDNRFDSRELCEQRCTNFVPPEISATLTSTATRAPISTAPTTPHRQPPQSHDPHRNGSGHLGAVQANPDVTANASSDVTLPCLDRPFSIVHLSWTFRDEPVKSNEGRFKILVNHSLRISHLSGDDTGPYRCTADDGHNTVSQVTNLVVYVPATIRPSDDLVSVRVSETARLACVAVGFPRPFVQWYRGGKQLPQSSARYATRGDFTLVIRNVTQEDEGIYMCRAYNYHGDPAVWKVSLSVLPPYPSPSRSAWRRRRRGHHSLRDTSEGLWRRGRKVYQSVRKVPQKGRGRRGGRRKFGKRG